MSKFRKIKVWHNACKPLIGCVPLVDNHRSRLSGLTAVVPQRGQCTPSHTKEWNRHGHVSMHIICGQDPSAAPSIGLCLAIDSFGGKVLTVTSRYHSIGDQCKRRLKVYTCLKLGYYNDNDNNNHNHTKIHRRPQIDIKLFLTAF